MQSILIFIIGALFGAAIVFIINTMSKRKSDEELQRIKDEMEKSFKALSFEIANQSSDQLIKRSKEMYDTKTSESSADLEGKKKLIDQSLTSMAKDMQERMEKVQKLMTDINQNVPAKYGQVSEAIGNISKQNEILRQTTESLKIALSGSQQRGQWGERMADDILRVAGFIEGKNYLKQTQIQGGKSRPDFTFLLPENLKVNMDVKFPLNKYLEFLQATDDNQREQAKKVFLLSVRARIKEVTGRDYINPDDNTVDYVLVFIPNEQVYAFIQEADSTVLDDALKQKVILCSPLTLYAMLALMHQAINNFNLRQSSREIQSLLAGFRMQWDKFVKVMGEIGERIDSAHAKYDEMVGTRRRMLDKQLEKIDQLNQSQGIIPEVLPDQAEQLDTENNKNSGRNHLLL